MKRSNGLALIVGKDYQSPCLPTEHNLAVGMGNRVRMGVTNLRHNTILSTIHVAG